jgi:hypothetical protein
MATMTARKQAEISEKMKLLPAVMNQMAEYDKRQLRVEHTLFGNGEPGMDERLRNIERSLKTLTHLIWIMTGSVGGYFSLELFKVVFAR